MKFCNLSFSHCMLCSSETEKVVIKYSGMDQFYSNEHTSLDKEVDKSGKVKRTKQENIDFVYDIDRCTEWIQSNNFRQVCLQFPDFLLSDSVKVAQRLEERVNYVVPILNTIYKSCCVDYIGAAHWDADAIIHFGPICFSKGDNNIPVLNVYEKEDLDVDRFKEILIKQELHEGVFILLDTPYVTHVEKIEKTFTGMNVNVVSIDSDLNGLDSVVVYVGFNNRKLINLKFGYKSIQFYNYNPRDEPDQVFSYNEVPKLLKRRHFLLEKIKDSIRIGIVIATVSDKNYLNSMHRIQKLIESSGRKAVIVELNQPTPDKLANYLDIDVYVVLSCALDEIYESREFFKPIVTPFDIELALNPSNSNLEMFSYDYNRFYSELTESDIEEVKMNSERNDVSLITGQIRVMNCTTAEGLSQSTELALKMDGTVALSDNSSASFLAQRSWRGLEQKLGENKPQIATEGRTGIACGYENEKL